MMVNGLSSFLSLDEAFKFSIRLLLEKGFRCFPRGLETLELSAFGFTILDPRRRYLSVPERRWSIVYAIGEFCWHARGGTSVDEIAHYAPKWKILNKQANAFGSCYGAKVFGSKGNGSSQWECVYNLLKCDPDSRRGVLFFSGDEFDIKDVDSDIACAISLQFLIRGGSLDAVCTMRSNDVILGMSYDIFLFTMLQEMMALKLNVSVGSYHHFAGSMHMYARDFDIANKILKSDSIVSRPMAAMKDIDKLPVFLKCERAVVLDDASQYDEALGSYWSAMLSTIKKWENIKRGQVERLDIDDSVLESLFNIRFG